MKLDTISENSSTVGGTVESYRDWEIAVDSITPCVTEFYISSLK